MEKDRFLDCYKEALTAKLAFELSRAANHYDAGVRDCKAGIYDKWYRYHTPNDGQAYDMGWIEQNKETENEKVTFLDK